ncbi:MAG: hypothetical protein WA057_03595 [Candidatus Magasanikiibacteriota bacterium]
MLPRFISNNNAVTWQERKKFLAGFVLMTENLFGNNWQEQSVWEWSRYLLEEIDTEVPTAKIGWDKDATFYYALASLIDFESLTDLAKKIEKLKTDLRNLNINLIQRKNLEVKRVNLDWKKIFTDLDLHDNEIMTWQNLLESVPDENRDSLLSDLENIAKVYKDFRVNFSLVSAGLLFYVPEGTFANNADFVTAFDNINPNEIIEVERWTPFMRYLGQACFSADTDMSNWAVDLLMTHEMEEKIFADMVDYMFFFFALHLAYLGYKEFDAPTKVGIWSLFSFWAIAFGVPISMVIEDFLATQPDINSYIFNSGLLAETLKKSPTILFMDTEKNMTVGGLIQRFEAFAGDNDLDVYKQVNYVKTIVKDFGWSSKSEDILIGVLHFFIHLREMDFIDYKGILVEEKAQENPYDWEKVIRNDFNESDLFRIRRYFYLLQRPILLKVQLVPAFLSVDWQKEPFLHRILQLNEIYQDVYGEMHDPIVYFDEKTNEWKMNVDLPKGLDIVEVEPKKK